MQATHLLTLTSQSLYNFYLTHATAERYAHLMNDEIKVICLR